MYTQLTVIRNSRKNERESKSITNESDRQTRLIRDIEKDLHELELKERDVSNRIRDKERMENDIERMKRDIITNSAQCKVSSKTVNLLLTLRWLTAPPSGIRLQDLGSSSSYRHFATKLQASSE